MSTVRQVRCDGCGLVTEEDAPGMIGLYVELHTHVLPPKARPGMRKRRGRPAYAELDLCVGCVAQPVNVRDLFEKHRTRPEDEDGDDD